jgi:hypothetical protein
MTTVQRLQRIEKKIDQLIESENKPCWVKSGFVSELTGWRAERLRQAREQGLVAYEERHDSGFWYDINSIHHIFFIHSIIRRAFNDEGK